MDRRNFLKLIGIAPLALTCCKAKNEPLEEDEKKMYEILGDSCQIRFLPTDCNSDSTYTIAYYEEGPDGTFKNIYTRTFPSERSNLE